MKHKILLDLDGVIANFCFGFATYLNKHYGCTLNPLADPPVYDFDGWGCGVDDIDFEEASKKWIEQGGFEKLPAFDGAKEFVAKLLSDYDVFVVTARVGDWEQNFTQETKNKIKKGTFSWVKKLGISPSQVYFTHNKIPFCEEHGIKIMIEDKLETAVKASKNKIHTVLMHRGYNGSKADRLRIYRVYNYDEALEQLQRLAGGTKTPIK